MADTDMGETIAPSTVSGIKNGAHPGFFIGQDDRPTDTRVVAIAIRVRTPSLRVGDREFSASDRCLHEGAILRRFYEEQGGSVQFDAGWPPSSPRLVKLTHELLKKEVERIVGSYIIPRENNTQVIAKDYLGAEPGEQLKRMHDQMRKQYEAWVALIERVKFRTAAQLALVTDPLVVDSMLYDNITPKELAEIIAIGDPSKNGIDDLVLPEVIDYTAKAVPGDVYSPPLVDKLANVNTSMTELPSAVSNEERVFDALEATGFDMGEIGKLTSLLDNGRDPSKVTNDEIVTAMGSKAKLKAIRAIFDNK